MNKSLISLLLVIFSFGCSLNSQTVQDTSIYLLTISPGTETYSIYGHSALRVVIPDQNSDIVYNWGVFDFEAPNFAWKFAKGRLNYLLEPEQFNSFLGYYLVEKRSVFSQNINLTSSEKQELLSLVQANLRPENRAYRYDFFYDDCSTRIRDLIEKVVGNKLIYPPDEFNRRSSFRELVGEYQKSYPWLNMGIDLIMGTPGEKKASFRDMMFLPMYLQKNLTQTVINRNRKMVPLLSNPEVLLQFDPPVAKTKFYASPMFLFSLLFIIIVILSAIYRRAKIINALDILLFTLFSALSVLMVFFNFFTDHQQMKLNINIIWFNPLLIVCLLCLVLKKTGEIWFRAAFYLSVIYLPLIIIIPNAINSSFVPVLLILILRSSVRGNFKWNPLSF
jgi:hypothetical protein